MAVIESLAFNINASENVRKTKYGDSWPVVYIINDKKEAYIGETVNASVRTYQHLKNPDRKKLTTINIISNDDFNKSVILDLENYLIKYMSGDGMFKLQNSNMGMHPHNYYQQEKYEKTFLGIWNQLKELKLVKNSIYDIQNSDIFKYSPYKSLNLDQYTVVDSIIQMLVDKKESEEASTILVDGGAGTGKTVLAIYLMKLLSEIGTDTIPLEFELDPGYAYMAENLQKLDKMKIGLVVPMQSLRTTVQKVFKEVRGLTMSMVVSPIQVSQDYYDLLIVDEAHRLRQRKALAQYPPFDKNNRKFGLGNEGTELDWILRSSKNQIFFYDSMQSVKPSDIDKEVFDALRENTNTSTFELHSQFRCKGGNDYIQYVKDVLSEKPGIERKSFDLYKLKLFDDVDEMIKAIKEQDKIMDLCRVVAGYSWDWISKKDKTANDIIIEGHQYRWNTVNKDWVNSPNAINEIGCIHTIQGYDLNYAGVIFGNEIKYDVGSQSIIIDKSNYKDLQGKTKLKDLDELKSYIINIYTTMMTRGIHGTFVYACDENLRNYLRKYF